MYIALDGSDLAVDRHEGPSVYAGELIPRLTHVLTSRGHRVRTYVPGPLRGVDVAGEVVVRPGSPFWTQRVFAGALRRDRPDALFLPIQTLPFFRPRRMATIAVVHDLEFLRYPETYTLKNRLLLRALTRYAVREATRLIAISAYTKENIERVYGRPSADITVIHHGVDQALFRQQAVGNRQQGQSLRQKYELPERYVLFVGAMQPRKNIDGLVSAFEALSNQFPDLHLVLVCGYAWKPQTILGRIDDSSMRRRIHLHWRVPREDLADFYRRAEVFVLPSFSEGFGMPVLEAMAAGTPVITSNTSSLPEVAGDAALLVDPRDTAALAGAIGRAMADASLRDRLVQKGLRRAMLFTWEKSAEATADVIESTAHPPHSVQAGGTLRGSPGERQQHVQRLSSTSPLSSEQAGQTLQVTATSSTASRGAVTAMPSAEGAAGQDPPAPTLSIVIVNWNSGPLLRRCLDALPAACTPRGTSTPIPFEVFVVDNASADDSISRAQESTQAFKLMAIRANVGFARANNLVLTEARGEVLLLLNPDTEPQPGSLAQLVARMSAQPAVGVMGAKLLNPDRSIQPSVRRFPTTGALALLLARLAHLFPRTPALRRYLMADFAYDRGALVDQVMGACFAIRRRAYDEVGPLDTRFWIWFEEVDYCRRVKAAGWQVWYEPSVEVVHVQAAAFRQAPRIRSAWWFSRSAVRYAWKHLGMLPAVLLASFVPVMIATAAAATLLRFPSGPRVRSHHATR